MFLSQHWSQTWRWIRTRGNIVSLATRLHHVPRMATSTQSSAATRVSRRIAPTTLGGRLIWNSATELSASSSQRGTAEVRNYISDVKASQIINKATVFQQSNKKDNIKIRVTGLLWWEPTDDRWNPIAKGQGGVSEILTSSQTWELLHFQHCMKLSPFNVWVRFFEWNFKGNLWNSIQNILPYIERYYFVKCWNSKGY